MVDATRDLIIEADDRELVKVEVPFWKDKEGNSLTVYISQMSGEDADNYVLSVKDEEGMKRNVEAIICCVCDKNGEKLFNSEDIVKLMQKNSVALNWLTNKVLEVNFKSSDLLEEEAKNS